MNYRDKFKCLADALDYDEREYASSGVSNIMWEAEKHLLNKIVAVFGLSSEKMNYLDFACGTGRVLGYLAPQMGRSVGIDVSDQMLALARRKVGNVDLICKDIANESVGEVEGIYDVITAFRFFSNAEDSLRDSAIAGLARRMHSNSILIANTHTNPLSYKLATWPYHQLRKMVGREIHARYLTAAKLCALFQRGGLKPIAVLGCGYIPETVTRLFTPGLTIKFEVALAGLATFQKWGVNQIVICKK
jgi:SAM-dependent methyltransferase